MQTVHIERNSNDLGPRSRVIELYSHCVRTTILAGLAVA
jgi:hypothetical protein